MALNRYSTSSRFSPKTTDPITGARIADPNKMGKISPQGTSKITSWPEFREAYKRGDLPADLLTGGYGDIPKDLLSYMKGDTNKLSEIYAEPEYNINSDTQDIATLRSIGDSGFKTGDIYTSDESNVGKRNVGFLRYDADDSRNKSMISRKKSEMKSYGNNLKDYIQGDTVASGEGSGSYSEEEMAGLYPDLQVGGDVGMSNFSQSVFRPSKKQIADQEMIEKNKIEFEKFEAEKAADVKKGPSRLKLIEPGMLKGGNRKLVGLDRDRGEYVDPKKPFVSYEKGKGPQDYRDLKGARGRKARRDNRRQNFKAFFGGGLEGQEKDKGTTGRFKNLGEKRKYKKEEKLAKSTYGRGLEDMTGGELEARKDLLKSRKREQISPFKRDSETNKITGLNKPQFFKNLSVNQGARKEIRDINRAQKYSKLVGGSETNRNIYSVSDRVSRNMIDKEKNPGPKYFKPGTMKNFRSSDDNPLNRNSISGLFE